MSERTPGWLIWAAVGVGLGLALGVAVGWWFWPVTYTNTSPDALREDHHDDYLLMIAATYKLEQDLPEARSRLESLNPAKPSAPVLALTERLIEAGGSEEDIRRLVHLAQALGAEDPTLTRYLESRQ